MGFNSGFKGLSLSCQFWLIPYCCCCWSN